MDQILLLLQEYVSCFRASSLSSSDHHDHDRCRVEVVSASSSPSLSFGDTYFFSDTSTIHLVLSINLRNLSIMARQRVNTSSTCRLVPMKGFVIRLHCCVSTRYYNCVFYKKFNSVVKSWLIFRKKKKKASIEESQRQN